MSTASLNLKRLDLAQYDTDKSADYLENYYLAFGDFFDKGVALLELGVARGGSLLLWRDLFPKGIIAGLDSSPVEVHDPTGRIKIFQGLQQDTALLDRIGREVAPQGFDIIIDDCAHIARYAKASFWHLFHNHLRPGGVYVIEDWGTGYWAGWPDGRRYHGGLAEGQRDRGPLASDRGLLRLRRLLNPVATGLAGKPRLRSLLETAYLRVEGLLVPSSIRSHDSGMVGLVKELIDACAVESITYPGWGIGAFRHSEIRRAQISYGQALFFKR